MIDLRKVSSRFLQRLPAFEASRTLLRFALILGTVTSSLHIASAETLIDVMLKAYYTNPQLNKERSKLRATDEDVVQALAGYRPSISSSGSFSVRRERTRTTGKDFLPRRKTFYPHTYSLRVDQTLFDSYKTKHLVSSTEARILAAREGLRAQEQVVLLAAITSYMDVYKNKALLNLRKNNVRVIQRQLDQTQQRFNVGEVTRTDVYQAKARLAEGQSLIFVAETAYEKSRSDYMRVIGEFPKNLQNVSAESIEKILPPTLNDALKLSERHPRFVAGYYGLDAQKKDILSKKGNFGPVLSVSIEAGQQKNLSTALQDSIFGAVKGNLVFPIYQRGTVSSRVRQAKENLTGLREDLEATRRAIHQSVTSAWSELRSAKARLSAVATQIQATKIALSGIKEEAKAGTRTTLDVLNAERDVLDAEVAKIAANRERIVQSYSLLSNIGSLSLPVLGIKTALYDPKMHYSAIRNRWVGTKTPSEERKDAASRRKANSKAKNRNARKNGKKERSFLTIPRHYQQRGAAAPQRRMVRTPPGYAAPKVMRSPGYVTTRPKAARPGYVARPRTVSNLPEIQIPGEMSNARRQDAFATSQTPTRAAASVIIPGGSRPVSSTAKVTEEVQEDSLIVIESTF